MSPLAKKICSFFITFTGLPQRNVSKTFNYFKDKCILKRFFSWTFTNISNWFLSFLSSLFKPLTKHWLFSHSQTKWTLTGGEFADIQNWHWSLTELCLDNKFPRHTLFLTSRKSKICQSSPDRARIDRSSQLRSMSAGGTDRHRHNRLCKQVDKHATNQANGTWRPEFLPWHELILLLHRRGGSGPSERCSGLFGRCFSFKSCMFFFGHLETEILTVMEAAAARRSSMSHRYTPAVEIRRD